MIAFEPWRSHLHIDSSPPPVSSTNRLTLPSQSPQQKRKHGARPNRRKEAKEEVVEGKGYAHLILLFRCRPHRLPSLATQLDFLGQRILTFSTVKDKANHAVILDKATSDKLNKDVQSYRLITVAVLVDRLKINGSLARKALVDLEERGVIKKVVGHSSGSIYTRDVQAE
jgi:small subunit ribosomal protein S25e